MPLDLDVSTVTAKLDRAEEHFIAVNSEIHAWINDSSHEITHAKRSLDHTRCGLVMSLKGPTPDFLRWTLIVGDCINNLRCALDHLVYSLAKYETRNNPTADIEKLAFIIVDSPSLFRERNNARKLNWLTLAEVAAIEQVQPYIRTHPWLPPLLEILRDFSNADKHRLLRLASAAAVS